MKKQGNKNPNEQLQLTFSGNSCNTKNTVTQAKIVDMRGYQQKTFIGFILKNSKPF